MTALRLEIGRKGEAFLAELAALVLRRQSPRAPVNTAAVARRKARK